MASEQGAPEEMSRSIPAVLLTEKGFKGLGFRPDIPIPLKRTAKIVQDQAV
jgi:hypothetical protein